MLNHSIVQFHAFLAATRTAFKSGVEMFDEFAKDDAYIVKTVDSFTQKARALDRKMQDRHMLVPKVITFKASFTPKNYSQDLYDVAVGANSPDVDIVREGYLYKRASNAVKSWQRRWFAIRHNMLLYRHRCELKTKKSTLSLITGRLAKVMGISPTTRSLMTATQSWKPIFAYVLCVRHPTATGHFLSS